MRQCGSQLFQNDQRAQVHQGQSLQPHGMLNWEFLWFDAFL